MPILVRPIPRVARYQVAYGHRRLAAAKELGLPVRQLCAILRTNNCRLKVRKTTSHGPIVH